MAGLFEIRPVGPHNSTMRSKLLLAMSGALCLSALSELAPAGEATGWMVAIPPFKPVGGTIVVDNSAPMDEWVRQGAFASEAACKGELTDPASRAEAAERFAADHNDPRLTEALKLQVVKAVRQARCVPVGK